MSKRTTLIRKNIRSAQRFNTENRETVARRSYDDAVKILMTGSEKQDARIMRVAKGK